MLKAVDSEWQEWGVKRKQRAQQRARRDQIRNDVILAVLAVASIVYWLFW